jgi:hypothetical protein
MLSGSKPASMPVIMLPGLSYSALPPNDTDHVSQSHAVIGPLALIPACCATILRDELILPRKLHANRTVYGLRQQRRA